MPVKLPQAVAAFNQRVTNPLQGHWAWLLPPYAVIVHRGRHTGRRFATPVLGFRAGDDLVVPLLYGHRSQWVLNLEAAGRGEVIRAGRRYALLDPQVHHQPPDGLSRAARRVSRAAEHQIVATIGQRLPGGPRDLYAMRPRSRRRGT